MKPGEPFKAEVIMAGTGGKGVLMAGQLLAQAALAKYDHVAYLPSYAASQRGGPCECTVVFSQAQVSSPLLSRAEAVIVMDVSQLGPYQARVKPGGLLVTEKAGVGSDFATQQVTMQQSQTTAISRTDIRVGMVPALETAVAMFGNQQGSNLILLGAYIGITEVIDPGLIESQIENRLSQNPELLARNIQAFRRGLELGAALGV